MKPVTLLVLVLTTAVSAASQDNHWALLRIFEGKWEGAAVGEPGKGHSSREYRFELDRRFLAVRNRSVYEPKSPGAKPEAHEDFGFFSYDKNLKKVVLRQFHIEGFVNEYRLDSVSADGKTLEFVTVSIENLAPGWRAKEAYRFLSADELEETFSLAQPSKDFEVYTRTRLKRSK